jgi:T5SS/PEP-CTERM-associated repeat protein
MLAGVLLLAMHQSIFAAIAVSGEVYPLDGGEATQASRLVIGGRSSDGSLTIDQGSTLFSKHAVLGGGSGTQGSVTVTGTGSFWGVNDWLDVGWIGDGELSIEDNAIVSIGRSTSVVGNAPAGGIIRFDNGTLITPSLLGSLYNLTGTGTIYTNGLIADGVDITVRSSFLPSEPFQLNQSPDQNITVYLSPDERGILGAGFDGTGSLMIEYPHHVDSSYGYIGYHRGSFGTVTVQGEWNIHESLKVGKSGRGVLRIDDEAVVDVQGWTTTGWRTDGGSRIEFNGGELITGTLAVGFQELLGTGTIHTQGMIADGYDLVIDAQHGTTQTIRLNNQPGQDIQIDLKLDSHYTLGAGYLGAGSLTIRDGVKVVSNDGFISYYGGSSGNAEVSGEGTEWRIHSYLNIGGVGDGILTIRDDALVMTENLWTGFHDEDSGKSFINMANGGKFAIKGKLYPTSVTLAEFYEVFIPFSDPLPEVIRYWDAQSNSWSDLFNATLGEDYTLEYFDTGDLAGYTVLTVHTPLPEPNTAAVLWLGLTAFLHQRRGR